MRNIYVTIITTCIIHIIIDIYIFSFILIIYNQKPIRVETCNARSQLPNIQCELIG